jgi:hypothetical protein
VAADASDKERAVKKTNCGLPEAAEKATQIAGRKALAKFASAYGKRAEKAFRQEFDAAFLSIVKAEDKAIAPYSRKMREIQRKSLAAKIALASRKLPDTFFAPSASTEKMLKETFAAQRRELRRVVAEDRQTTTRLRQNSSATRPRLSAGSNLPQRAAGDTRA